ncbi:hypothetical protein ACWOQQ_24965 [Enterobacter sp. ESY66]|uniref:hypothetical protein n=1 Tax=Enterobacter kobei TaxID=208224 RepID=UPI0015F371AB|nr:hypothetical protein [Enterobacter kobei]QMT05902.1 hypothetical protein H1R18_22015 [Enterobacter kobei]HBM0950720.1 hypothetical protein [Enterobacter kobei]HBM0980264.1 hypothetical protein [Enterobacter kobei]
MYALAVEGTAVTDSAIVLADSYLRNETSRVDAAESLVLYESLKACGSGFSCGLAGGALLPLTVTADVCSSLFIQMRLCAAVAIIGGHDTADPRVRLLCWGALAGDACSDTISGIITRLLTRTLSHSQAETALLTVVRDALLLKSSHVLLRESLLLPLLSGVINGGAAWLVTRLTGQFAIRLFIPSPIPPCTA